MTEGRLEAMCSRRPAGYDTRLLWTQTHPCFRTLDAEIRTKESCPYHDLRANGCFQPEPALPLDPDHRCVRAEDLCARRAGKSLMMGASRNRNVGCGGALIPEETEPLPAPSPPKRSGAPWTKTTKGGSAPLFSAPPYVSCPPVAPPRQPVEPHFRTGAAGSTMGLPYPYMPDGGAKLSPPRAFRLKAGCFQPAPAARTAGASFDDTTYRNPLRERSGRSSERPAKKTPQRPREPYLDNRSLLGTFGQYPRHIPEPYHEASLRKERGCVLLTYAAKSKRCPPIIAPWSTLVHTNEAAVDCHGIRGQLSATTAS